MAKFRSQAPARKRRPSVQPIRPRSTAAEMFGDDMSALTENSDYPPFQTKQAAHDEANCKPEEEDDVALPIPIAMLVTSDGREQPIYQPIPGLEHMFKAPSTSRPSNAASNTAHVVEPQTTGVPQQVLETADTKPAPLKRRRSSQGRTRKEPDNSGDDEEEEDEDREAVKDKSYSFYIGDIDQLQKFLRQRFNELTMKPLRGIVTNWIRQLEPRRLGAYGKYHEMLPSEMPEEVTPPWWPRNIIYKEPSHLKKHDLLTLAIEVVFVHRKIDEIKRREPWVDKLRQVAVFAVETTAPDNFSSSKGSEHSEQMRQRALTAILPSLFEVAQSYEDHIIQYGLFEGSGNVDSGKGRHHTWQAIPRPARQPLPRKRVRRVPRKSTREQSVYDVSADEAGPESKVVPAMASAQTPAQHSSARTPQIIDVDSPCTPVERRHSVPVQHNVATPASSFNQSMHSLQIDLQDKTDVKYVETSPNVQTPCDAPPHNVQHNVQAACEMLPYSPSTAYTACGGLQTGFSGQMFQPMAQGVCAYSHAGGLPFDQQSVAGYGGQYPMYMTGYPAMAYGFEPTMPAMSEAEYGYGEYSMAGPSY